MPLAAPPPSCFPSAHLDGRAHVFVLESCDARVVEVAVSAPGLRSATMRTSLGARGRRCTGRGTLTCPGPFAAGRGFRVDAASSCRSRTDGATRAGSRSSRKPATTDRV